MLGLHRDSRPSAGSYLLRIGALFGGILSVVALYFAFTSYSSSGREPLSFQRPFYHAAEDEDVLQHVFNETLGFQKIFAISMPSRTDQRDQLALAAKFTNLQIDVVDGVKNVSDRVIPPGGEPDKIGPGNIGAWRAHMNVMRMIVEQNIGSALVLEGDADWDINIKSQMYDIARAQQMLVQPLIGTNGTKFLDPTFPMPKKGAEHTNFDLEDGLVTNSTMSPYGDLNRWDMMWIGHCGSVFPNPETTPGTPVPMGRVLIKKDKTCPDAEHYKKEWGNRDVVDQYPPHTRVVSRAQDNVCTIAYAVTQQAAQQFLYDVGMRKVNAATDIMLKMMCDGREDRLQQRCFTSIPQVFNQYRPAGPVAQFSNINWAAKGYNQRSFTTNIRWPVRLNFQNFVMGKNKYIDQFAPPPKDAKEKKPPPGRAARPRS